MGDVEDGIVTLTDAEMAAMPKLYSQQAVDRLVNENKRWRLVADQLANALLKVSNTYTAGDRQRRAAAIDAYNAARAEGQARAIADDPVPPIDRAGHAAALADAIAQRDAIIDKLIVFLGVGPHECSDGWHWVYASRDVLEPLTEAEVAYFEDWTFPLERAGDVTDSE